MVSEENIRMVAAVTGLEHDREFVIALLRKHNGDPEAAIGAYFDNGNREYYVGDTRWDETAFTVERDGTTHSNIPAMTFDHVENVHGPVTDPNLPPYSAHPPPSRPPSRANSRSPLGAPRTRDQEEADLQRAMQMSAAEAGLQPQENGVVATTAAATGADGGGGGGGDTSVKYFGPANRSEYDQAQWGMVHVARSTEPPPTARRRQQGVPAFLRNARALGTEHQPTYHRLGSLLTILHEIPAARNFLVRFGPPDQPLPDSYGHGADWWKGEPIIPPDVLAAVQRNEIQWGDDTEQPLHHELHRLMAFLDGTDRSYGSADSIIEMRRVVAVPTWGGDLESLVLAHMKELAAEEAMLFLTPLTAEIGLNTNDRGPDQQLFMVDFEVHRNTDVWAFIKTLYNAFDIFCWSDILVNGPEPTHVSMKVFTHTPPVLTMRFTFDGVDDRIDVPETLYLDRYMEERRAEAIEIQLVIVDIYRAVSRARELEERLVRWTDSSGHSWDKREQLAKTIRLNQERIRAVEQTARWRAFDPSDILETPYDDDSVAPLTVPEERLKEAWENEIRLCEERLAEITVKLQRLQEEKDTCQKIVQRITKRLTNPDNSDRQLVHKYHLRGVATTKDVVYVCRRAEPDLIEMGDGEDDGSPRDQWWRLAYIESDPDPLKVQKVTLEEVLQMMWDETKTPMLVYATEEAINEAPIPLSGPLQTFVRHDNRLFQNEIQRELTAPPPPSHPPPLKHRAASLSEVGLHQLSSSSSPSGAKRKYRSNSMDSLATNRASMGDDQDLAERGELLSSFGMGGMGMDGLEDDAGVPLLSAVDDSNVPPSLATARATATLRELAQNYGGDNGGSDGGVGRWNVESNSLESPTLGRLPLLQQQQQQQEQHEAAISAGYSDQQATAEESQAERNVAEGREKLPEMQERTGSMPLIAQLAPGSGGRQQSAAKDTMDMDMDIS